MDDRFELDVSPPAAGPARELGARHALRDGRAVAVLRAVADGAEVRVEALVYPTDVHRADPILAGPYRFGEQQEALAFLDEAADALVVLGCRIERS